MTTAVRAVVRSVRRLDQRLRRPARLRRILVDGHTPVNYTMIAPVYRAMQRDARVAFCFTASRETDRLAYVYHEASDVRPIHPRRAALMRFDAYVTSDFLWAPLLRGTRRVQIFHGVGGKYGFDAPDRSVRVWDRLFFVNQRRLRNYVGSGAIAPDSPAIRLVGMPKVDCLVNGTFQRDAVLASLGLDPALPTVLYAPTWSPASSLNAMGLDLVRSLQRMPINLIVKLHDRSRDLRDRYSGGEDWAGRIRPLLDRGRGVLAEGHDISPFLVGSDLMITDHSSAGFEYLLRDRPIVRINRPALIELAQVHPDYVSLLASVADSVDDLDGVLSAVERGLAEPGGRSEARQRVAADLFYKPGGATARAIKELYDVLELEPLASVLPAATPVEPWLQSA